MAPDNIEFTLNFLTGQIHALFMVTQMLANAQPEPAKVLLLLDTLEQSGIANLEASRLGMRRWTGCGKDLQAFAARSKPSRRDGSGSLQSRPEWRTVAAASLVKPARP
jgi:hypothetical protein